MAQHGGKREGAGRKRGFASLEAEKMRELLIERLKRDFMPIVEKAIEQALVGNQAARDWLTDRALGRAVQALELSGPEGESLVLRDDQFRQAFGSTKKRSLSR